MGKKITRFFKLRLYLSALYPLATRRFAALNEDTEKVFLAVSPNIFLHDASHHYFERPTCRSATFEEMSIL